MLSKEGFAMKSEIRDILKVYFRNNLLAARGLANIPQDEMAYRLGISTRAYTALEDGDSCCGITTFLSFLIHACPDPNTFWEELLELLKEAEQV